MMLLSLCGLEMRGIRMNGNRIIPRNNVVRFFAASVDEAADDMPAHGNDNCCPHCGGVMLPGDKASDCSVARGQPMEPRPRGQGRG
jgi:hypothetical protein